MIHVTREMSQSGDGLNHQGAWVAVYDTPTLTLTNVTPFRGDGQGYQTASHSFGIYSGLSSAGEFLNLDLGDNYPRGIVFHIDGVSKLVYAFKTLHGEESLSPAGVPYDLYSEISSESKQFYKWSNDNNVYTELASPGFIEVDDGFIFFFLGENPSLDNS